MQSDIPLFDPACGSGHLLHLYNKQELARNKQELARFYAQSGQLRMREVLQEITRLRDRVEAKGANPGVSVDTGFRHIAEHIALNRITVDTLVLQVPVTPGMVRSGCGLEVVPVRGNRKNRVLWQDETGARIEGAKAVWKGGNVYVEIAPLRAGYIGQGTTACRVTITVPDLLGNGDNSWPTNCQTAGFIIDRAQSTLEGIGITADLRRAQVVRCDLNRNIVPSKKHEEYRAVADALDVPRTTKTRWGAIGIRCRNQSQQISLYDKSAEMKKKSKRHLRVHLPERVMRAEWRVLGARNVRHKLGVDTAQDLLDKWDGLSVLYVNHLRETWFRWDITKLRSPRALGTKTPTQHQIRNLVRWCKKHEIAMTRSPAELRRVLDREGLKGYAAALAAIPGIDRKHLNKSVRLMREAYWQEKALSDPDFV